MSSNRKLPGPSAAASCPCSNCSCVNEKHNTARTSSTDLYLSNASAEKLEEVNKAISNIKQRISANCNVLASLHQNSTSSSSKYSTSGNKINSYSMNPEVLDKFKSIDSFSSHSVPQHQDFFNVNTRESQKQHITSQNSGCSSSIPNVCCSRRSHNSNSSQRHFTWLDADMPFQRNNPSKAFGTQSNSSIGNKIRSTIEDEIRVSFENAQKSQNANTKNQNISDQVKVSSTRISNHSNHLSTFKRNSLSTGNQISKGRDYILKEPIRRTNQVVIAAPVENSNLFTTQNYPPKMSKSQDLSKISHYTSKEERSIGSKTGRELSVGQHRSKSLSPSSKDSSAYDDTHRKITFLKPIPIQNRTDNINSQNNKGKSSKIKITLNINVETGGQ